MNIAERVKHVVIKHLGSNPEKVRDTADLFDDLGADSLDLVELVMALEDEFNREIPDRDITKFRTVGDVVAYLSAK